MKKIDLGKDVKEALQDLANFNATSNTSIEVPMVNPAPNRGGEDVTLFLRNLTASMAENTARAYLKNWKIFSEWCASSGLWAYPANGSTIARYIDFLKTSGKKASSIAQAVASIRKYHEVFGVIMKDVARKNPCESIEVKTAMKAVRRELGTAPAQKDALTADKLAEMFSSVSRDDLKGLRDKALVLLGFAGAFRRSELVSLTLADLEEVETHKGRLGYMVTVRHSKTDQEGAGMIKAIFPARNKDLCPVRALQEWLEVSGMKDASAHLFPSIRKGGHLGSAPMTVRDDARVLKRMVEAAGLNGLKNVSGHSLRRGFVTTAINKGASAISVMNQTGHKSISSLKRYIDRRDVFQNNASEDIL